MKRKIKSLEWNVEFNKNRYIPCGKCIFNKKGYAFGLFRNKVLWSMLPNTYYEEDIREEFPNEYYQSINQVPKYRIFKHRKKIGFALPRKSIKGDNFLFIPQTKTLRRHYYIWDVDENHEINRDATIFFDIAGDNGALLKRE